VIFVGDASMSPYEIAYPGGSVEHWNPEAGMVKVVPFDAPEPKKPQRLGFLKGRFQIPDDFNEMGAKEIEEMFGIDR
jgi:hypothetical protein